MGNEVLGAGAFVFSLGKARRNDMHGSFLNFNFPKENGFLNEEVQGLRSRGRWQVQGIVG